MFARIEKVIEGITDKGGHVININNLQNQVLTDVPERWRDIKNQSLSPGDYIIAQMEIWIPIKVQQ